MSHSINADRIMLEWKSACLSDSGKTNVWYNEGKEYRWVMSTTQFCDGAVAGSIYKINKDRPISSFRIDGDGTVVRAPKFLRRASSKMEKEIALQAMKLRNQ